MKKNEIELDLKKMIQERQKDYHYFYCICHSKSNIQEVISYLGSLGINLKFEINNNYIFYVFNDHHSAYPYKKILDKELLSLVETKKTIKEKIDSKLPNISNFGISIFRSKEGIGEKESLLKNEKFFIDFSNESDIKLKLTQDTLQNLDIPVSSFISNIFFDYLNQNFLIKGKHSFKELSDKICNEIFKNSKNSLLDTNILTSKYYTFLYIYAEKKDILCKERRIDKLIRENIIDLYSIASKLRQSLIKEGIFIEKKNLVNSIDNYEEFDEVDESDNYKSFESYELYVQSEGADIDFSLSNTVLARRIQYGDINISEDIIRVFSSYFIEILKLTQKNKYEEKIELFYSKKENQKIHINDALVEIFNLH